jgi:hypothetical protein
MNALFTTSITVSLVVVCALGVAAALRHRSAALRHWVLSAAIMCALAAPLVQIVAPSWRLPRTSPAAVTELTTFRAAAPEAEPGAAASPATSTSLPFSVAQFVVPVWLTGAALSLSILFIAMVRLTRIASRAERVRDERWIGLAEAASRVHGLRHRVLL